MPSAMTKRLREQIRKGVTLSVGKNLLNAALNEGLISLGEKRALDTLLKKQVRVRRQVQAAKPEPKNTGDGGLNRYVFDDDIVREAKRMAEDD